MNQLTCIWLLIGCFLLQSLCQETDNCRYRKWERQGTLKLLVIAGIHEHDNGQCGTISASKFPLILALDWVLDIINGERSNKTSYLPNITLGYDIYDNCDDKDQTVDLMYPGIGKENSECTQQKMNNTTSKYAGVLALTSSESTTAISRLADNLPVFRPFEPAPILNAQSLPNLIQTVASFEDEANALVQFLVEMKWNFVFLVHSNDSYGTTSKDVFLTKTHRNKICIPVQKALTVDYADMATIDTSAGAIIRELFQEISRGYEKSIVVVYLGNSRGAFHLLQNEDKQTKPVNYRIGWLFSLSVTNDLKAMRYLDNSQTYGFSVAQKHSAFQEFNTYFMNVLLNDTVTAFNEWKSEYIHSLGCDITKRECHSLLLNGQNHTISSLIDSVLTYAGLLHILHNTANCQNEGLCSLMQLELSKSEWYSNLNDLNFKATFPDDYLPEEYQTQTKILQFTPSGHISLSPDSPLEVLKLPGLNTADTIGEFDGTRMTILADTKSFPTSACNQPNDCSVCREHYEQRYTYLHGDVLLLGLFSLHQYGETPFKCGVMRHDTNDPITVSAFMESIKTLREETGIAFGGIAIDDCYSAFNTSAYLSDLFSKKVLIGDPETSEVIDFDNVFVIVGALSSPVSLVIGDLSTAIGVPMVSYGASSPELDNDARYPYFLRTVPSDTRQVKGIVELLQSLNVSFVGAVYINDAYGKNGIKALLSEARGLGICVDEPIAISQDMNNATLTNVTKTLYERQTRVVIYFSIDSLALRILDIMSNKFKGKEPLVFVASEAWGTNRNLLEGQLGQKAKGSIVFNVETVSQDNIGFRSYLRNLNASQTASNAWIPKYFEDVGHCDFITSFGKSRLNSPPCSYSLSLDETSVDTLYQDQRSVHVIHAVHASGHGYKAIVNDVCGSLRLCPRLRHNGDILKRAVQDVNLGVSHNFVTPFDSTGSGNIGFTIFNIQRTNNGVLSYVNIGSYSKSNKLSLTSKPKFYNDLHSEVTLKELYGEKIQCSFFKDRCSDVCHLPTEQTSPQTEISTEASMLDDGSTSITLVTTIILAVLLAILVVALILIIAMLLRRQNKGVSDETFSKSHNSSVQKFPSTNNIYNEVNDYQGSHPRSQMSRFNGIGSHSLDRDSPIQYSDIRQSVFDNHAFYNQEPRSEVFSVMSSSSVSPGMLRPSKPFVEHTRSLSDSKILDSAMNYNSSKHNGSVAPGQLSTSNRSEGLENLHELHNRANYSKYNRPTGHKTGTNTSHKSGRGVKLEADNYPDSDTGSFNNAREGSNTLNYISAKDLINHSDEEDDADEISDSTITYTDMTYNQQPSMLTQGDSLDSISPNVISPSDHEVMAINFPDKDSVTYSNAKSVIQEPRALPIPDHIKPAKTDQNSTTNHPQTIVYVPKGQGLSRTYGKSSMSSVPDIIPYDGDDFHRTASDSDEENVFII